MNEYPAIPGEPTEMTCATLIPPDQWESWLSFDDFTTLKLPAGQWTHVTLSWPPYPVTPEMLQHLRWVDEYARQGKRYPCPRRCRSKARMSRKWREYGKGYISMEDMDYFMDRIFGKPEEAKS